MGAARVGRASHPSVTAGITPGQVDEARKDLGRWLAAWRIKTGLAQVDLARRTCYSRSAVANVETGRQHIPRVFWQRADAVFGAGGALLASFDQVDALARDFQAQATQRREGQRQQQRAAQYASADGSPHECGCPVTVARWTGREIRALREALRMSVRVFAEYLGMSATTVTAWEHPRHPSLPALAAQALLDQALTLADADATVRFGLILGASDGPCDPSTVRTDTATGGSVTAMPRPARPSAL